MKNTSLSVGNLATEYVATAQTKQSELSSLLHHENHRLKTLKPDCPILVSQKTSMILLFFDRNLSCELYNAHWIFTFARLCFRTLRITNFIVFNWTCSGFFAFNRLFHAAYLICAIFVSATFLSTKDKSRQARLCKPHISHNKHTHLLEFSLHNICCRPIVEMIFSREAFYFFSQLPP